MPHIYFKIIAWIFSAVLLCTGIFILTDWLREEVDLKAVEILAPTEPGLALPIFAQFKATQVFEVNHPIVASKLILPIYVSDPQLPLQISLRQQGIALASWSLPHELLDQPNLPLLINQAFYFEQPQYIAGSVELEIDGTSITHADQSKAPRVFIEKDDARYATGHYSIAGIPKKGDIGLTLYHHQKRWHVMLDAAKYHPLTAAIWLVKLLLALFIILIFPLVIFYAIPSPHQKTQTAQLPS